MRAGYSYYRFAYVFYGARNAVGIPADLFVNIDTTGATNLSATFASTFHEFAYNSTSAAIPAGLFDTIDTSSAIYVRSMFQDTFDGFANYSSAATIPPNLFNSIDISNATDVTGVFSMTFYRYAFSNKTGDGTPDTDVNDIWGSANFAGKVTADNANSVFYYTFDGMKSLIGTAQAFIDNYLGGVVPAAPARTFINTSVDDLSALAANWQ
jgi:hypothetical protein